MVTMPVDPPTTQRDAVSLPLLVEEIRKCRICEPELELGARPVLSVDEGAKIAIIGQAPGTRVHASGVPWNDPSGVRLRQWLNVDEEVFYDPRNFAIIPMGFCYPGKGRSGDLPPRPECAPAWHDRLWEHLPNVEVVLLFGRYALQRYLDVPKSKSLTAIVQDWREHTPRFLPFPHPSPRNVRWMKTNPWFFDETLPYLRERLRQLGIPGLPDSQRK